MSAANLISLRRRPPLRGGAGRLPSTSARLLVAMADPANVLAVDDIALMTGSRSAPRSPRARTSQTLITRLNRLDDVVAGGGRRGRRGGRRASSSTCASPPTTRRSSSSSTRSSPRRSSWAPRTSTSSPRHGEMRVRFRVDGVLSSSPPPFPRRMVHGVVSRIKIMADLDISERRVPQDGRVGLTIDGRHVDLRVVTLPSVHGESLVMRILDKESRRPRPRQARDARRGGQALPQGLQAGLRRRARHRADRLGQVDLALRRAAASSTRPRRTSSPSRTRSSTSSTGITQVQVNTKAGLTFATGLRSMMRADPDIIMVGEIRDRETAQIAIEAALTGHLVLSTLHTNDAPTRDHAPDRDGHRALPGRQRRRLRRRPAARPHALLALQEAHDPLRRRSCGSTASRRQSTSRPTSPRAARAAAARGYKGRIGLYEVMTITEEIRALDGVERASADAMRRGRVQRRHAPPARRRPGEGPDRAGRRSPRSHASREPALIRR